MKEIAVIGGGIAGCSTALALAEKGFTVSLFEHHNTILSQSGSNASSNCFGVGFYHLDEKAAEISLETCIRLLRYLKLTMGHDYLVRNDSGEPARITFVSYKAARVKAKEVLKRYEHLRQHYRKLIEHDKENAVLGPLDSFYKHCSKDDFPLLNLEEVEQIVDTCDCLFDWDLLRRELIQRLDAHSNITLHCNTTVVAIQKQYPKTILRLQNDEKKLFDYVVNCAFENSDYLNQTAGFTSRQPIENKKFLLLKIRLPSELKYQSFLFGFDNLLFLTSGPDEIGYLTYTPTSYLGTSDSHSSLSFVNELESSFSPELAQTLLDGAVHYIPLLKKAEILALKPGIIRSGTLTIIDEAEYRGLKQWDAGLLSNEARQHTFWHDHAQAITQIIENQEVINEAIAGGASHLNPPILRSCLLATFFQSSANKSSLLKIMHNKQAINEEILGNDRSNLEQILFQKK